VSRAFASELVKMRTTRTFFGLVLAALVLTLIISVAFAAAADFGNREHPGLDVLAGGGFSQIIGLVLGVLAVTTEFRHGTITPSLLAVPDRTRLVLAKLGAGLAVGFVLGVLCVGLGSVIGLGILSLRGIPTLTDTSEIVAGIAGGILCATLFCGIGVGLGAIIRNQVGAIIGVILWMLLVEPLLGTVPGIGDAVSEYGLGGGSSALATTGGDAGNTLNQLPGGLLLVGYCVLFTALGIVLMRRRDISA